MPLARSKARQAEPLPFLRHRRDWRSRMRALLHRLEHRRQATSARSLRSVQGRTPKRIARAG